MSSLKEALLLYAVTDDRWSSSSGLEAQVEQALRGGATMLQFREKQKPYEEALAVAKKLQALCKAYKVPFIINDNVQMALELQADGVHLGQNDMDVQKARRLMGSSYIIGATAKTVEQAKTAMEKGADYLGSGAVFGTTTKSDAKPMDLSLLSDICNHVSIPVVAIGGIDASNILQLSGTGISGVAVVSGIFAKASVFEETAHLLSLARTIL